MIEEMYRAIKKNNKNKRKTQPKLLLSWESKVCGGRNTNLMAMQQLKSDWKTLMSMAGDE